MGIWEIYWLDRIKDEHVSPALLETKFNIDKARKGWRKRLANSNVAIWVTEVDSEIGTECNLVDVVQSIAFGYTS